MHSLPEIITRLRNAQRARRSQRSIPLSAQFSKPRLAHSLDGVKSSHSMQIIRMFEMLRREGYIQGFTVSNKSGTTQSSILVDLKYNGNGVCAFRSMFVVSTAGRRIYLSTRALWQPQTTNGIFIMSTPNGLLTDREAREHNVGGEILFGIF